MTARQREMVTSWRKSSFSDGNINTACVEIAFGTELAAVRDSKNTAGPTLAFPASAWRGFVTSR